MSDQPHDPVLLTQEVRELLQLICQTDITELQIERGDAKIHVKRGMQPPVQVAGAAPLQAAAPAVPPMHGLPGAAAPQPEPQPAGHRITSPMVGTFYAAPSPKDPPYVKEGDEIHPGDVVGIVEAMKLMNEIESEIHGRITTILVQNGQPVEYGQPLLIVEPLP